MDLFVLDTDVVTLFQRGHAAVTARVAEHASDKVAIAVVRVEEQLSGWYAQVRKAKGPAKLAWAYRRLAANVRFVASLPILDFDEAAIDRYAELKRLRLKVGKMDLQIAATVLKHGGTLGARNVRDFKKVPELSVEDWSK